MKELNMMRVGSTISFNNFSSIFSAAGTNTNTSLTMPEALPQAELQNLLMSAGPKKLSLQFSGLTANTAQLIALLSAAVGPATTADISSINSLPLSTLPQVAALLAGKERSISIDCATASSASAVAIINMFTDPSTSCTVVGLNALTAEGVNDVIAAIGTKPYTITLDGKLSTPAAIIDCVTKLTAINLELSITNGGSLSVSTLSQVLSSVGIRKASLALDVLDLNPTGILAVLGVAGVNTDVSIASAHTFTTAELTQVRQLTSGKRLSLEFNGRQLGVDPVNGDKLQQAVAASDMLTTITVNTAQYPPLSYLLPIIQNSSNTNLIVAYNGGQLSDTDANGNVVVRGIEVAAATTIITVTSVGDGSYSIDNYLKILSAAG
ncbi:hypothetical protein AU074_13770 [Pseudomonas sp. ATCC PTA-122608]|uniref:hypothetical protein n=1 Tax=Pseudomonas sp. ATCC PTA-122608 TaxID=1771311 RepID=UPI00096B91F7|nr:hypothetical protein [Pseudomonas sp. ATCC PTA-122608]OLY72238.1 hypothetical protein AU074_13770 [Pseudomonas sp. ATCC PTA-122608]